MEKPQNKVLIILAFFAIYVIWGSTYLLNKIAISEIPAFSLAAMRFIISGGLIFIIARIMGISLKITRDQFKNTVIAGFLFLTFGNGLVVWALKYVDSGFAALEISAQPLVVLVLMRVLQGKKIKPMSMIGVALGVLGIYILVSQNHITIQEGSSLSIFVIFICMLSWAYGSLFVAKANLPSNYFVNTGYQMFTGGIMLLFVSYFSGETWSNPSNWSPSVFWSLVMLIIFGSIVAFTSFNYLLKAVSPEKVATSAYVNPIIALFLGWLILNEKITMQSIIAAIVLLTGVYFINSSKRNIIFSRFRSKKIK